MRQSTKPLPSIDLVISKPIVSSIAMFRTFFEITDKSVAIGMQLES